MDFGKSVNLILIVIVSVPTGRIAADFGKSVNTILKVTKYIARTQMAKSKTTASPKSSNTTDANIN